MVKRRKYIIIVIGICAVLWWLVVGRWYRPKVVLGPENGQDIVQEIVSPKNSIDIVSEEIEPVVEQKTTSLEQTQQYKNETEFYRMAKEQGIDQKEASMYLQKAEEANLFDNHTLALTEVIIADMDGNGQKDMAVSVDMPDSYTYGTGCIYFCMNEDEPYCFQDEEFPFFFGSTLSWADVDNDGNTELLIETVGTGCGAAGDWYHAILKYKDHKLERMKLPYDSRLSYGGEIEVVINIEAQENTYSAYVPHLDETIIFEAPNANMHIKEAQTTIVGGNVRGFFDVQCVTYQGRNALQAVEYLCGEGGTVHALGVAVFIIEWDEQGNSFVADWWIVSEYGKATK